MNSEQIKKLELETGALGIDSDADDLHYLVHNGENRVAVLAGKTRAILSAKQAAALARELGEILEIYGITE